MTNERSLFLFNICYNCVQGPLRCNSEISSYNSQTDRQDAGRPLKHRLPVKPSAMSSVDGGGISDSVAKASDDDRHGQ
jgi:hypothetical protein